MKDSSPIADQYSAGAVAIAPNAEETLVVDSRAGMTPSQMVEQRLIGMLKGTPLLVSHIQRRLKPGPR